MEQECCLMVETEFLGPQKDPGTWWFQLGLCSSLWPHSALRLFLSRVEYLGLEGTFEGCVVQSSCSRASGYQRMNLKGWNFRNLDTWINLFLPFPPPLLSCLGLCTGCFHHYLNMKLSLLSLSSLLIRIKYVFWGISATVCLDQTTGEVRSDSSGLIQKEIIFNFSLSRVWLKESRDMAQNTCSHFRGNSPAESLRLEKNSQDFQGEIWVDFTWHRLCKLSRKRHWIPFRWSLFSS